MFVFFPIFAVFFSELLSPSNGGLSSWKWKKPLLPSIFSGCFLVGKRIEKLVGSINNQLGVDIRYTTYYNSYIYITLIIPVVSIALVATIRLQYSVLPKPEIHPQTSWEDAAMNCEERLDDLRGQSVLAPMEMAVSCLETMGDWRAVIASSQGKRH